jgi:hypothetical protein
MESSLSRREMLAAMGTTTGSVSLAGCSFQKQKSALLVLVHNSFTSESGGSVSVGLQLFTKPGSNASKEVYSMGGLELDDDSGTRLALTKTEGVQNRPYLLRLTVRPKYPEEWENPPYKTVAHRHYQPRCEAADCEDQITTYIRPVAGEISVDFFHSTGEISTPTERTSPTRPSDHS